MKNLNQIDRIKIKLRLAKNTDLFLEVFGSSSHKYQLNKPLNNKEIEIFENKYNIILPSCYKTFLTEIGNGGIEYKNSVVGNSGAGPYYGIFNLGHPYHFIVDTSLNYLQSKAFFNSETSDEKWSEIYDNIDESISDENYDKEVAKAYAGILNIGYCGCSGYLGIILNGRDKGRVVHTYDEIEYCPHFVEQENFLDWYEDWLNNIINGKSIKDYGRTSMTEKQCIERFQSDKESYWKMVSLAYIRNLNSISVKSIETLWNAFKKEKDKTVKAYLLNLLSKFDYNNAKKELVRICKKKPLSFLNILHLYVQHKTFEWKNETQYIQQKHLSNSEIIEYIEYITKKDTKTTANNYKRNSGVSA